MATWNGARALGRADLGRFAKGARPGVLAIEMDPAPPGSPAPASDGAAFVLANLRRPRRMLSEIRS
jgi:cytosine/adenosine deaminase-related metal-dependent hydrolase